MDIDSLPNDEVVNLCKSQSSLHKVEGGVHVVKILNTVAVKIGVGVTGDEARNQSAAFELINPNIIRVPRVFRFFVTDGVGYLVMEYVDGRTAASFPTCKVHGKMLEVLDHLESIRRGVPGAVGGGYCHGLLWSEYHSFRPSNIGEIERYFSRQEGITLDLTNIPLVLCHLDRAERNILVDRDDQFYLLDWSSAGFYPRWFEICAMRINTQDSLNTALLRYLEAQGDYREDEVPTRTIYRAEK